MTPAFVADSDGRVISCNVSHTLARNGVDSASDRYEGPSEISVGQGSSADSPFVGKTPQECQALLEEVQSNSPQLEIDTRFSLYRMIE